MALLIDKRADVNAKNYDNWTALQMAARKGNKNIVQLLISKGVDINVKNDLGQTALDIAMDYVHPEIIELLKQQGGITGSVKK